MPSSLLRDDVLPVAVGYLLVMGALATGLRLLRRDGGPTAEKGGAPAAEKGGPPAAGWAGLARRYAGTALGGYLLLMAVLILYYYGVSRVGRGFITGAFTGCALLIALSTPVFALASWLAWLAGRRRARPGRKAGG